MAAAIVNLIKEKRIERGADYDLTMIWKPGGTDPADLTGYTAKMQVRKNVGASTVLLELSTSNSGIILGKKAGTIQLIITNVATTAIIWKHGVYDLELTAPSGKIIRFCEGLVEVSPEVTI